MGANRANAEPWGEALHRLEDREGPVVQVVQAAHAQVAAVSEFFDRCCGWVVS